MAYDSSDNAHVRLDHVASIDGSDPLPDVLKTALQDIAVPHEVKALLVELGALDPVNATLEARTLARALKGEHRDAVGIFGGGPALRRSLLAWERELDEARRHRSAARLVEICNHWSDEALRAVL